MLLIVLFTPGAINNKHTYFYFVLSIIIVQTPFLVQYSIVLCHSQHILL